MQQKTKEEKKEVQHLQTGQNTEPGKRHESLLHNSSQISAHETKNFSSCKEFFKYYSGRLPISFIPLDI